jgi:hypothetical protein
LGAVIMVAVLLNALVANVTLALLNVSLGALAHSRDAKAVGFGATS